MNIQDTILSFDSILNHLSGDSELDRMFSGWITSPSLGKFGGSYPQGFQTCPFSVGVCSLSRGSSGDSELDSMSSGWITSPSLSKFGGSYPQGFQTCPFSVGVSRGSRF